MNIITTKAIQDTRLYFTSYNSVLIYINILRDCEHNYFLLFRFNCLNISFKLIKTLFTAQYLQNL